MRKDKKIMEVQEFIICNWEYYFQFVSENSPKKSWIRHVYHNMCSHNKLDKFFKKMEWNEDYMLKYIEDVIEKKEELKKELPLWR